MEEKSECKHCRTWEEEMYWKHFNSMHFCQTFTPDFHDHLVLPKKFASHVTTQLPDKVSLKGPSGALWEIELLKSDDLLFVGSEWKDFVKANDLKEQCLLIFKYIKNSHFEVLIFDQGSCEKEAAYFVKKCRHTKSEQEDQRKRTVSVRGGSSTEIIENDGEEDSAFIVSKKSRKDDGSEVSLGGKVNTQTPRRVSVYYAAPRGRARGRGRGRGGGRGRRVLLPHKSPSKPKVELRKRSIRNETRNKSSQMAQGDLITPENGQSSPTNDHSRKLEDQSKKSLNATDTAKELCQTTRELITPENGEKSPAADHSDKLKSQSEKQPNGNDTTTELSHSSGRSLTIIENGESFQATEHSHKSKDQSGKRPRKNDTPKNGEYSPVIDRSHRVEGQAEKEPIGSSEAKEWTPISGRGVMRPDYREDSPEEDQSRKSFGRRSRSKKNELPNSSKTLVFKSASDGRFSKEYMSNRRPVTEKEIDEALKRATQKETEKSFTVIMRPTTVYKRFFLNVPGKWLQKHLPHRSQEVVLRVGDYTWLTTLFYYGTRGGGISTGWKKFSLDNNLEEFDVLVFTLVNQKDEAAIVMDVDIFRVVPTVVPLLPVTKA